MKEVTKCIQSIKYPLGSLVKVFQELMRHLYLYITEEIVSHANVVNVVNVASHANVVNVASHASIAKNDIETPLF